MSLLLILVLLSGTCYAATAPDQPGSGPGSSDYKHAKVIQSVYGQGEKQYWIYEPASSFPASAAVIVFLHGWDGTNPMAYGSWIEHLVRRGNVVIYPRYQTGRRYPPSRITSNALEATREAIKSYQRKGKIRLELHHFAVVGHSAGGQVAANFGALWQSYGLPQPKAIMSIQPGKSWNRTEKTSIPLEDMSRIPRETLLLAITGDQDTRARDIDAKRIFNESTQVPLSNKDFVILISDPHGTPSLRADHFSPCSMNRNYDSGETASSGLASSWIQNLSTNALDYYGYWKLFDALTDAAFYHKNRNYALGNTAPQRYMGKWSDGVPVKELFVTDTPSESSR